MVVIYDGPSHEIHESHDLQSRLYDGLSYSMWVLNTKMPDNYMVPGTLVEARKLPHLLSLGCLAGRLC